jgi:hypothetical protein
MTAPKIERPRFNIVCARYKSQHDLTHAFIRMQEYYESPYPEIRGRYFTLRQFKKLYVKDHGAPFSYYTDWHGFNIPGEVLVKFKASFAGSLNLCEQDILKEPDMAYLIGIHREDEYTHELAHALYHTDKVYRRWMQSAMIELVRDRPKEMALFKQWLLREGYADDPRILLDEFQAYFATNDLAEFEKYFDKDAAATLWQAAKPVRQAFSWR